MKFVIMIEQFDAYFKKAINSCVREKAGKKKELRGMVNVCSLWRTTRMWTWSWLQWWENYKMVDMVVAAVVGEPMEKTLRFKKKS
jgi:hypothetical protein